jgi:hypothetical protein
MLSAILIHDLFLIVFKQNQALLRQIYSLQKIPAWSGQLSFTIQ